MTQAADHEQLGGPEGGWWYNTRTNGVERGPQSLGIDRIGPFATEEEAKNALQTLRDRSAAWEDEEAEEAAERDR